MRGNLFGRGNECFFESLPLIQILLDYEGRATLHNTMNGFIEERQAYGVPSLSPKTHVQKTGSGKKGGVAR